MLATFACFWTLPLIIYFTVAFFHCKRCAFIRSKPHYCQTTLVSEVFLWVGSSCWEEVALFHCKSCAFIRSTPRYKHTGFRGFLWVGSSCWEEVTLFHCKSCAFSRSKPHYCQTHWFQMFFVGWLIMLGRGGSLSLQELCFQ